MSSVVPSKIFPNLYLGSEYTAVNKKVLDELNIKAIINITPDVPNYFEKEGIYYHQIPVGDDLYTEIACYFEDAVEFINSHIKNGKSVLVHCRMGISRSPSIVIAYIMKTKNIASN